MTDHLRDYAPNMEKYKMVQISPMSKNKNNHLPNG